MENPIGSKLMPVKRYWVRGVSNSIMYPQDKPIGHKLMVQDPFKELEELIMKAEKEIRACGENYFWFAPAGFIRGKLDMSQPISRPTAGQIMPDSFGNFMRYDGEKWFPIEEKE